MKSYAAKRNLHENIKDRIGSGRYSTDSFLEYIFCDIIFSFMLSIMRTNDMVLLESRKQLLKMWTLQNSTETD